MLRAPVAFIQLARAWRKPWPKFSAFSTTIPSTAIPKSYARDDIPKLDHYPGGQTLPTPKAIDFKPGQLLGSVSGELGLRKFLESQGHTLVVTSDKDGPNSVFERELPDAEIVISQPFWPAYLTEERIKKAKKLKLAITAGIGSDHVDLQAAMDRGITVAEVTYCNSISVSEHVVMMILALVRNYIPSYGWVVQRRLEHRRLRRALLRSGRHERRHGRRRPHRPCRAAAPEAVRREAALHRPPPPLAGDREGAWPHLPQGRRVARQGLRRGDDQRAAASRDRAPVQRQAHLQDEARLLHREHGARQDLRSRRHRARAGERPARGIRGRRVVPAAGAARTIRGGPCPTTA